MPQSANPDRIANAEAALTQSHPASGQTPATPTDRAVQLRDLLVDLMHYADAHGTNFDLLLEVAHRTYHREAHQALTPDDAGPFATIHQQVIGLLAQDVTAAVRNLNAALTPTDQRPGLTDPQITQRVLDDLARAARHLARAFPQFATHLKNEHAAGRLTDVHHDPDQAIELAILYLEVAKATAASLASAITRTHQAITSMKTATPNQPTPAQLADRDFPTAKPDLSAAAKSPEAPSRPARDVPNPRNTPRI